MSRKTRSIIAQASLRSIGNVATDSRTAGYRAFFANT